MPRRHHPRDRKQRALMPPGLSDCLSEEHFVVQMPSQRCPNQSAVSAQQRSEYASILVGEPTVIRRHLAHGPNLGGIQMATPRLGDPNKRTWVFERFVYHCPSDGLGQD